jgi:2-oxoisovalerate dehydrogenase E2 component (dihydrolipoyl transacylase)
MSELKQFKLPDVGEGLTEADIVKWLVEPGDTISVNQIIVEIETAKAVVELPSPYQGVVDKLLVAEGTTADVGTPIISVRVGEDADPAGLNGVAAPVESAQAGEASAPPPADTSASPPEDISASSPEDTSAAPAAEISAPPAEGAVEPGLYGSPAPKEERQAVLVGYGVKLGATKRRARRKPTTAAAAGGAAQADGLAAPAASDGRTDVLAKPPVRKLAKDLGVDLAALTGTGPSGSITRDDIQAAAAGTAPGAEGRPQVLEPAEPGQATAIRLASLPREERIPIRGVRKVTAAAVTSSAFTAPHVTEFLQIDVTQTMAATARLKSLPEFEGLRVSPLVLVAKALLVAAGRHPMVNSSWDEAAQEIVVKHYVNLGIAAATGRGLLVPNVKDAHALSLPGLARAIGDLAETARAGKSTPADLRGGTITITNVGVFGVDTGTPIITPGEAAILAIGQIRDAPWVVDGQLAVRKICTLALSFDHRIIDGELGSAVLRDIGAMLTDPLRMLAWS